MAKIIALFILDFAISFIFGFLVGRINIIRSKEDDDDDDDNEFVIDYNSLFPNDEEDESSKE